MKNLTRQNPGQLFVAQELINKVKSKCCGIKVKDILVEVYHIGSTAVKGLAAKSIIDIMPVVTNISLVDKHNKEFVAIGYECMGEFGIEGRRYFGSADFPGWQAFF